MKRILVIRFSSIGDIVLSLPLYRELKNKYKNCIVDVVVKEQYRQLLENNSFIDNIIGFKKEQGFLSLLKLLKQNKYDLIIDLHKNIRSFFIKLFLGCKSITYRKNIIKRFLLIKFKINLLKHEKSVQERYLECIGKTKISRAQVINESKSRHRNIIGISPSAYWFTKIWDKYEEFIERLIKDSRFRYSKIIIFGGERLKIPKNNRIEKLTDKLSLKETIEKVSQCCLLVTNDTGIMHIANEVGTPVCAIFGPTVREFGFFPVGKFDIVLEKPLPCRPCSLHGSRKCPLKHFNCMKMITVDEVMAAVYQIMQKSRADVLAK